MSYRWVGRSWVVQVLWLVRWIAAWVACARVRPASASDGPAGPQSDGRQVVGSSTTRWPTPAAAKIVATALPDPARAHDAHPRTLAPRHLSEAAVGAPRHQRDRSEVGCKPVAFGSRQRRELTYVAGRIIERGRVGEQVDQPIDGRRLEPELLRRTPQRIGVMNAVERGDELRSLRRDAPDHNRTLMMDADLQGSGVAPHTSQGGLHDGPHGHLLGARCRRAALLFTVQDAPPTRSVPSNGAVATRRPQCGSGC